ncbi:hypothetical protein ACFE04_002352 [Oxalis oulophora]
MNTLFPATLLNLSPTTKSQRQFKPKPSSTKTLSFTSYPKPQASTFSTSPHIQNPIVFNDITWPQLLKTSIGSTDFPLGQSIHACLIKLDRCNDVFVGNNLVNLYAKFDDLDDARRVFDQMPIKNTITWTTLIKGYLENGDYESLFRCASNMFKSGEKFNEHTCSVILKACESQEDVLGQKQVHAFVIKSALDDNVVLATSLISTYMKSDMASDAEKVFNNIGVKDVRCLNSMILEYERAGYGEKAILMFIHILNSGMELDDYSFTNVISACNENEGFLEGLQLHGLAIKYGYVGVLSVGNAIVRMYTRHGMVNEAEKIFSGMCSTSLDLISWTTLISGYARSGDSEKAIFMFLEVLESGILCDSGLLATVFDICSEIKHLEMGRQLHGFSIKLGNSQEITISTAVVDLYAKCGNLECARLAFDCTAGKSTALFNALLAGFTETSEDVTILFNQLRLDEILKPDVITFSRLLSLSANQACMKMKEQGFIPDEITILSVLQACSYSGLCEEGIRLFHEMGQPTIRHYACMIDLLGRASRLSEAMGLIQKSPFANSPLLWRSLVNTCKLLGNMDFGLIASKYLLELRPEDAGSYMLVSNMYAEGGMLDEAAKVRRAMNDLKIKKEAGCSWIEIDSEVHCFVASDKEHKRSREIYNKLNLLRDDIKGNYGEKSEHNLMQV